MTHRGKGTQRTKPIDLCFVLDATKSLQSVFLGMINKVSDLTFDLYTQNRQGNFQYGAIIYRDPVDWRPLPEADELDEEAKRQIAEFEAKQKQERIQKLKETGDYDEELEAQREEMTKHFDIIKYPPDRNVAIPFTDNIEHLVNELSKVECDGGHDDPEDWIGALKLAFDLEWRDKSKRCLIWITDANAHGKRFCGFDNHNEEEAKMDPLIKRLVEERFYFIGINVIKNDEGCKKTLEEIQDIYQHYCDEFYPDPSPENHPPKFAIQEFKPRYDEDLYGNDNWPAGVLEDFMNTIKQTLDKLDKF